MISKCRKTHHDRKFIGGSSGFFLFEANINQKGRNNENVERIDPGPGGVPRNLEEELIGMIDEHKKSENEDGAKGPDGEIRSEEGDREEQGGDE